MTVSMILRTVFEFALVCFTLWALFHEDRFAAFERRLICTLRRRSLKVVQGGKGSGRMLRTER